MGIVAGLGGLVGGAMGMFGGGSKQPDAPNVWQAPNMNQTANNYLTGVGGLSPYTNFGQYGLGQGGSIYNMLQNNPGALGYMGGANFAGGLGQLQALNQYGAGNTLTGAGIGALPYAQSIFGTAMDPQQALYNRTLQQTQDQTRAGLESRGLDMTPYGAGVEGQTLGNFNIDWQNQQLQRQIAGAQGGGGLINAAGTAIGQGNALSSAAPGQFFNASGMPYNVFQQLGQNQFQNLGSAMGIAGQGQGLAQGQLQDWANYLQIGEGADKNAIANYQAQLEAQKQQFQENQVFGRQMGNALYGLGQGGFNMGNMFGGGGGNAFWPSSSFMSGGMSWG
jgi:hypothetical protein